MPPRRPVQVGGLVGDLSPPGDSKGVDMMGDPSSVVPEAASQQPRPGTARCATALLAGTLELEAAAGLLACTKSLDEIGALFEMSVIGSGDKGSGWHDYLGAYERLLLHLPLSANILEAGVRAGASLAMWSEYFPFGRVVGIDKDLSTFITSGYHLLGNHGAFRQNNVRVVQANASDVSVLDALKGMGMRLEHGWADVIVDDANHWARDQIARFEILFPDILRRGGVYIIEDVHIQVPYTHDGTRVRDYFANLSAAAYLTQEEILVGAHQLAARRNTSKDWRHQVESVTFMRDLVAIAKAA